MKQEPEVEDLIRKLDNINLDEESKSIPEVKEDSKETLTEVVVEPLEHTPQKIVQRIIYKAKRLPTNQTTKKKTGRPRKNKKKS
jgi:hypothetical protein